MLVTSEFHLLLPDSVLIFSSDFALYLAVAKVLKTVCTLTSDMNNGEQLHNACLQAVADMEDEHLGTKSPLNTVFVNLGGVEGLPFATACWKNVWATKVFLADFSRLEHVQSLQNRSFAG